MDANISAPSSQVNSAAYLLSRARSISVAYMKSRASKPSPADIVAAAKLREIWDEKADALGITQLKAASLMEMTQPAVSQYLRGIIPLGFDALMKFSKLLDFDPLKVRQDLPEQKHLKKAATNVQEQNHLIAIQMAIRSLVKAMASNTLVAAAFADHLELQAEAAKFSDESGLLAQVIDIAVPGRRSAAAAVQHRKRRGSGG
jgi:transcriptional regulator with XRE-family HTH domain